MNVLLHTFRGLLAVLLALGMQLPCPCPSMAAPGSDMEQDAHSCCPGGDDSADATSDKPDPSDDNHACSHCSDDHFTKAAAVELPTAKALSDSNDLLTAPPAWLVSSSFLLGHPSSDGIEHLLSRPPPVPFEALPTGRTIRIHTCSFLC